MAVFLGLDSSTQGIKAVLADAASGRVTGEAGVNFGADLPGYGAPQGYLPCDDPLTRHADPLMWLAGLDLVLRRLAESGADLAAVAGVSGAGQQHGSVYLNASFADALARLDPARDLAGQLAPALARATAPIWMDRSTAAECAELTARFGAALRERTGSAATERFTGPQIRRFAALDPAGWEATAQVHLVSSFLCSVLCGAPAPIDFGDGAGMNLLDLAAGAWDAEIAEFTAPGLLGKLPPVVPGATVAGGLSPYFARYGLRPGVPVTVWTGDNPASLVGTGVAAPGAAGVSLGTSDTFFSSMPSYRPGPENGGHVMGNPAGGFMTLICFSNGSLAREKVKADCGVDWDFFDNRACALTPPGNGGRLMLPYFAPETTPLVLRPGPRYNFAVAGAAPAERVRAILESQALAMRLHSAWAGEGFSCLRLTGGASGSAALRQVFADVFQTPVETIASRNSAALGAAMRAANASGGHEWGALYAAFARAETCTRPNPATAEVYAKMLAEYAKLEAGALGG